MGDDPQPNDSDATQLLLLHAAFRGWDHGPIKRLSGFKKHHQLPDNYSPATRAFIQRISDSELNDRLDQLHQGLKEWFSYKRREMTIDQDIGMATVQTPHFTLNLRCDHDESDLKQWNMVTEVTAITDPEILQSETFAQVFNYQFSCLDFEFDHPLAVERIIDRIEDFDEPDRISVKYPIDVSSCTVTLSEIECALVFEDHTIRIEAGKPSSVEPLLATAQYLPVLLESEAIENWID